MSMRILTRALLAVLCLLALLVAGAALLWAQATTSTVGDLAFANELRIPPLLEPSDGIFELEMQEGRTTWGFNGPYLGPTLRASRGDRVEMRVRNELPESSTVHWHGMHLPAAADGGPHQMIEPGDTWRPSWTIDQPAATLWYHPHPHGRTEDHVYRGLAGMFIVDDPRERALALPRRYGVDDVPVIVQDVRFDDGELSESQGLISPIGRMGDEILVNGTSDPHLVVTTTRVRLRLLNASTARIYAFGFAGEREFDLIATDGGLLAAPQRLTRVQLSPGERAEVVVEVEPGEDVVLRSFEPDLGDTDAFNAHFAGGDDSFDILELRAGEELDASPPVPAALVAQEAPAAAAATEVRRFELGSRDINGLQMDMDRIDQRVPIDETEIWEIHNRAGIPHNFHVHDTRFLVLEPKRPALGGLKDTVQVLPGETVRVVTRFSDYSDPATPYMFHCHLLQHEDRGMMGQFVVVEPGDDAAGGHHE